MKSMLTRAKMRTTLLWLPLLFLGVLQPTTALCILEDGSTVYCHDLEDAKYIATYNLTSLTAPVGQSKLSPSLLENLVGLTNLDLSRGELTEIESGVFRKMDTLRKLNLANNNINHLKLTDLDGLKNLEALDLRGNALKQIPPALIRLEKLRVLEISGNPLDCNCATLRVRDLLLLRDVQISKSASCGTPSNWRGTALLELDADTVCLFEEQDEEMQADQAIDFEGSGTENLDGSGGSGSGSGDFPLDNFGLPDDELSMEYETPAPTDVEAETPYPIAVVHVDDLGRAEKTVEGFSIGQRIAYHEDASVDGTTEDQNAKSDAITASSTASIVEKELLESFIPVPTSNETSDGKSTDSDLTFSEETPDESESTKVSTKLPSDDNFEEEGSGSAAVDDSDLPFWDPFGITSLIYGDTSSTVSEDDEENKGSTPPESFPGVMKTIIDSDESAGPAITDGASETTPAAGNSNTGEPSAAINESEKVSPAPGDKEKNAGSPGVVKTILVDANGALGSTPASENFDTGSTSGKISDASDVPENVAPVTESKKGMSSYIILGAVVVILVGLIGYAALKNKFCKKPRKRDDVEGGRELKDMQKSLLDGNSSTQPKISSNGNSENAPLVVTPDRAWGEPGKSKPWNDENLPVVDDQLKRTAQSLDQEPVKPPRKSMPPLDDPNEATTEGKPLEPKAFNGVKTPPNSLISEVHVSNSPPLSPNAQRVKITLQDNVDSVPKTPILITRTKAGENLVKTP